MADLKISQLTDHPTISGTDEIIINSNAGTPTTKKSTVNDLVRYLTVGDGGDGGGPDEPINNYFDPIQLDLGDFTTYNNYGAGTGLSQRGDIKRQGSVSCQMPPRANGAIIMVYYAVSAYLNADAARGIDDNSRNWVSYHDYRLGMTGASFTDGGANEVGADVRLNLCNKPSITITGGGGWTQGNMETRQTFAKFEEIYFDTGAEVTFTESWTLRVVTQMYGTYMPTRILVLPFRKLNTVRNISPYGGAPYKRGADWYFTPETYDAYVEARREEEKPDDVNYLDEGIALYEAIGENITKIRNRIEWTRPYMTVDAQDIVDESLASLLTIYDGSKTFATDDDLAAFAIPLVAACMEELDFTPASRV